MASFSCYVHKKISIWKWSESLGLTQHLPVFQALYGNVDGFALSRAARSTQDAMAYVYGEIDFLSFIALLSLTHPNKHTVFYDLGSGVGKAVIACAMVFSVRKSSGIELFDALHSVAHECRAALSCLPNYHDKMNNVHFVCDDFFQADFHDATLIFINATAFFGDDWIALSQKVGRVPCCETVITTSKPLKTDVFYVSRITEVTMSWGCVCAYIHERIGS